MSNLNDLTSAANMGDFNATIEDGKLIITPSDAGIQLFAYVAMSEEQINKTEAAAAAADKIIEDLRQDNADLRDLLEQTYSVLMENGSVDFAEKILNRLYPITGTWEDGTTMEFKL